MQFFTVGDIHIEKQGSIIIIQDILLQDERRFFSAIFTAMKILSLSNFTLFYVKSEPTREKAGIRLTFSQRCTVGQKKGTPPLIPQQIIVEK